MTNDETLFNLLNALLNEGKALTTDISEAVRAPDFDLAVGKVCLKAERRYLATVDRISSMLEDEDMSSGERRALVDIVKVSREHATAMRDLLEIEIRALGATPEKLLE